jgi:hypothetical protein
MTSFFRFANKKVIYLDGKISLALLNKSENNFIGTAQDKNLC